MPATYHEEHRKPSQSPLSERLVILRTEFGLTQEALAHLLGLTYVTVASWEDDRTMPNTKYLINLAQIFDVSADYLLGLTDNPQSHYSLSDLTQLETNLIKAVRDNDVATTLSVLALLQTEKDRKIDPRNFVVADTERLQISRKRLATVLVVTTDAHTQEAFRLAVEEAGKVLLVAEDI